MFVQGKWSDQQRAYAWIGLKGRLLNRSRKKIREGGIWKEWDKLNKLHTGRNSIHLLRMLTPEAVWYNPGHSAGFRLMEIGRGPW